MTSVVAPSGQGRAGAGSLRCPVAANAHPEDREWTHDPLERSFFSTIGKGYVVGIVVFGLFGFLVARTQAPDWAPVRPSAPRFVAVFAGILGGVVLIGLWAMKNEELIRGNETGHAAPVDVAQGAAPADAEPSAPTRPRPHVTRRRG